ncbi:MAG: hypothetical protein V3W44_05640 [Dehalococcoidales bacterium]
MPRATAVIVSALAFSSGCSSTADGIGDAWKSALEAADVGESVFSFQFVSAPPEGALFRAHLHPSTSLDVCGGYDPFATDENHDGSWVIVATIGATAVGTYSIVPPSDFDELDRETASSRSTLHVAKIEDGDTRSKIYAIEGAVTVSQGPSAPDEWSSESELDASVEATFAATPWVEKYCDSVTGPNGPESSVCYCENAVGEEASCDAADDSGCCFSLGIDETIMFTFDLRARPCKWLCSAVGNSLFEKNCLPLNP